MSTWGMMLHWVLTYHIEIKGDVGNKGPVPANGNHITGCKINLDPQSKWSLHPTHCPLLTTLRLHIHSVNLVALHSSTISQRIIVFLNANISKWSSLTPARDLLGSRTGHPGPCPDRLYRIVRQKQKIVKTAVGFTDINTLNMQPCS